MLHINFEFAQLISVDAQVRVMVAGPHMDAQLEQHVMHIDFESLRYVHVISIDVEVLVIIAGPHMDMQPDQHTMHLDFESLRNVQLISSNE